MPPDVRAHLSSAGGRDAVNGELTRLLRHHEFDVAEGVLVAYLTQFSGQVATACRGVLPDQVEIGGWDQLVTGLRDANALGVGITAVGLDLSNFSDVAGGEWWDKEPVVEVTWYDDDPFAFSVATRRHLLDASELRPLPWDGAGAPGEPAELPVSGLRAVNGALLRAEAERPWTFGHDDTHAEDRTAAVLGGWFLHLRFHQAVARQLAAVGSAMSVPVVVGQHGVGPSFVSAYLPGDLAISQVSGHQTPERTGTRALLERAKRFRRRGQADAPASRVELAQETA
jgi:hypothetical protein